MKIKTKILYAMTWNKEFKKEYPIYIYAEINTKTGKGKKISKDSYEKELTKK